MFWKRLKKPTEADKPAEKTREAATAQLPLQFLQQLIPIGDLPIAELKTLPIRLRNFNPGDLLFNRGEQAEEIAYLYSGEVFMEAGNGAGYLVEAGTFKACYPLATYGEQNFNAIAKSAAQAVYLPLSALQRSSKLADQTGLNLEQVPPALRNTVFFERFCQAFKADNLHVPSLPDVALRLRSALQKDISIGDAVKILNLDPVISSKLIQVANSPIYRSNRPITSSHDAVNRLGFKTTQNLVTSISLHQLFKSRNKQLNQLVQSLWKQSIQVASLSHTLAGLSGKINADEALLAGLTHNIGALPVVTLAETLDVAEYTETELHAAIEYLQGMVGAFILKKWRFPDSLQQIPLNTNNWYFDDAKPLQVHDIVLLAKFHSRLGGALSHKLPPLNTLPAFHKLGDSTLTPDMSLKALQDAKQQIAEALNFFRT
ncbi:HDOD domain-containing protein [Methylomonas sp. DH-1]|uniref:HDOD domain-containing protein n=1 Tax=Methylomonas sp. (strain DH-1) TaxID=1727196 RepID=UPI0007C98E96|nr:HDOD domain-containing protein [Methylomonas sp. DH-1]ANE54156.1 cyclic nucleotide-binding protein [Methylomonas sp. DH-1]